MAEKQLPGDLVVPLSVVLAERRLHLEQILDFRPGLILEFSRRHDSPLDLYLNGSPAGQGYAVDIGERLGFQIEDVAACPQESAVPKLLS